MKSKPLRQMMWSWFFCNEYRRGIFSFIILSRDDTLINFAKTIRRRYVANGDRSGYKRHHRIYASWNISRGRGQNRRDVTLNAEKGTKSKLKIKESSLQIKILTAQDCSIRWTLKPNCRLKYHSRLCSHSCVDICLALSLVAFEFFLCLVYASGQRPSIWRPWEKHENNSILVKLNYLRAFFFFII